MCGHVIALIAYVNRDAYKVALISEVITVTGCEAALDLIDRAPSGVVLEVLRYAEPGTDEEDHLARLVIP
jgi:hypothetical protein